MKRKDSLYVLEAPIRQAPLAGIRGGQHAFGRAFSQQLARGRVRGARLECAQKLDELVLRDGPEHEEVKLGVLLVAQAERAVHRDRKEFPEHVHLASLA